MSQTPQQWIDTHLPFTEGVATALMDLDRRVKLIEAAYWMTKDLAVKQEREHWQMHLHQQDRIVDELHQRLRVALGLLKEIADDLDMEAPNNPGSQKAYELLKKERYEK